MSNVLHDMQMLHDMQIARTTERGWHNLAIGEPHFLQAEMAPLYPEFAELTSVEYPPCDGDLSLRNAVSSPLHPYVVVANGAKQAIAAAVYAMAQETDVEAVGSPAPYWPTFRTIATAAGMMWSERPDIQILAWPNNPLGSPMKYLMDSRTEPGVRRIWDAVYASAVYGWRGEAPLAEVKVGSASKTYGLSGIRLGWAAFHKESTAKLAAQYLETTTSGVSVLAQNYFLRFLKKQQIHPKLFEKAWVDAAAALKTNADTFLELSDELDDIKGAPAGDGGMFAFFKPKDKAYFDTVLHRAKVKVLDGEACGSPGYIRMSLGLEVRNFQKAIDAIKRAL